MEYTAIVTFSESDYSYYASSVAVVHAVADSPEALTTKLEALSPRKIDPEARHTDDTTVEAVFEGHIVPLRFTQVYGDYKYEYEGKVVTFLG